MAVCIVYLVNNFARNSVAVSFSDLLVDAEEMIWLKTILQGTVSRVTISITVVITLEYNYLVR